MSKEKETVVSEVVVADNTVVTAEDHCRLIGVRMQILLQTLC